MSFEGTYSYSSAVYKRTVEKAFFIGVFSLRTAFIIVAFGSYCTGQEAQGGRSAAAVYLDPDESSAIVIRKNVSAAMLYFHEDML